MVAKISVGNSLYGAIAYNGEKINEAQPPDSNDESNPAYRAY